MSFPYSDPMARARNSDLADGIPIALYALCCKSIGGIVTYMLARVVVEE